MEPIKRNAAEIKWAETLRITIKQYKISAAQSHLSGALYCRKIRQWITPPFSRRNR